MYHHIKVNIKRTKKNTKAICHVSNMGKNINKANEEKLKLFLQKQKKNDIKSSSKKTGTTCLKSSAN
jgi:ribonucleotide monophosphatase NagD (HAD superfamily)